MATPTFSNNEVVVDFGKGANHQLMRFAPPNFPPSHFNPVPVSVNLAGGVPGIVFSGTITAQGGTSPFIFTVTGGALPTGTSLNPTNGVISGTPTATGTFNFTITVTDSLGFIGSQLFQIKIATPLSAGSASLTMI